MIELRPYQHTAVAHLIGCLKAHNVAIDASETGVGKTYTALAVTRTLGQPTLVVCPKAVIPTWERLSIKMGVPLLGVINIEKLKTGNTPFLKKGTRKKEYIWLLKPGNLLIVDEAHRCGGPKSENCNVLAFAKSAQLQVLALSATIAHNPMNLRALGYLCGLHQFRNFWSWSLANGCFKNPWGGISWPSGATKRELNLKPLHTKLFPEFGLRLRIADLGTDFPENEVIAEAFDMDRTEEIQTIYDQLAEELQHPENEELPLTKILRARQQIELLKVPILREMADDLLEEGKSVVIFVSFRETVNCLASHFLSAAPKAGVSMILGGDKDRQEDIDNFQNNTNRLCICTISAGGLGIGLHDTIGDHPRVSLISPPYSVVELIQALGRIHRNGGKSPCVQKIIFAAGTVEEEACNIVRRKLLDLSMLQDGDLEIGLQLKEKK